MKLLAYALLCLQAGLITTPVQAGRVTLPGLGNLYQVDVSSYKERRFRTVVRQQYDYSCGSAAIATLLSYHYDQPLSEQQVFDRMLALADREKVRREGFSMLDMKLYLESLGYLADGYRLTLDKIDAGARVPVIVIINTNGYNHFVVVRGVREGRVLVADPAVGARVFEQDEFEASWNGLALLIRSHADRGRSSYDTELAWQGHGRTRYGLFMPRQSVAQFLENLPRTGEY